MLNEEGVQEMDRLSNARNGWSPVTSGRVYQIDYATWHARLAGSTRPIVATLPEPGQAGDPSLVAGRFRPERAGAKAA
jgi:hypothetical protein